MRHVLAGCTKLSGENEAEDATQGSGAGPSATWKISRLTVASSRQMPTKDSNILFFANRNFYRFWPSEFRALFAVGDEGEPRHTATPSVVHNPTI